MNATLVAVVALAVALAAPASAAPPPLDPVRCVDPFIGTGGHGHTFPGASVPFGMVQVSPDTRLEGWDGCSGYHDDDTLVYGFSHTHLSGTGVSDYGDILLVPGTGPVRWGNGADGTPGYAARLDKRSERASPGYYVATIGAPPIGVELTASARTGAQRFTFPAAEGAWVLLDLAHRDHVIDAWVRVVSDRELEGLRRSSGWARDQWVYFVLRSSKPFAALFAVGDTARAGVREARGTSVKAALRFATRERERVTVCVGLSATGVAGARAALDAEDPRGDFDLVHARAESAWRAALARIAIAGGTSAQDTVFYTALYHALLQPNLFADVDGSYRGHDGGVHRAQGWTPYTVFSLWDTFRAAHPLYTLLEPARTNDFVRTFLAQWRASGRLPVWELAGNETNCMIGYHAVSVIADAWAKGIRGFDPDTALAAMTATANADRFGLPAYRERGYVPGERESESVSKTLEYAFDDACIARFAAATGHAAVRDTFLRRAASWRNVFDPATGFMRPRIGGCFKTPFDPAEVDFHFTEANSWQYSFFVPQDVAGHIAALGGPERYGAKLDSLFAAPARTSGREQADITGLIGQYAHGNEPSHAVAWAYDYAGQPWKTQRMVRRICDSLYAPAHDGLAGNEDCGQMSAWYVLAALGLYQVAPGCDDVWVLASPLFPRASLLLPNGRTFTITTHGGGPGRPYVRSALLNGVPLARCFLHHAEILAGGTLAFELGAQPNHAWGVGPGRTPASSLGSVPPLAAPYAIGGGTRFRGHTSVTLACLDSSATIRCTRDGSEPLASSPAYLAPLAIDTTCTLRFAAFAPDRERSPVEETRLVRIVGARRIVSCTDPHRAYTAGGADALIDGVRGGDDFRLGTWMGFYGTDVDIVVDLGETQRVRHLALGCLQDQNSWIFMPRAVRFDTSPDGVTWTAAGEVANETDERADGAVLRDFGVTLAPRTVRWVRVHATAPIMCPAWHKGADNRSFVFCDEVVVE